LLQRASAWSSHRLRPDASYRPFVYSFPHSLTAGLGRSRSDVRPPPTSPMAQRCAYLAQRLAAPLRTKRCSYFHASWWRRRYGQLLRTSHSPPSGRPDAPTPHSTAVFIDHSRAALAAAATHADSQKFT